MSRYFGSFYLELHHIPETAEWGRAARKPRYCPGQAQGKQSLTAAHPVAGPQAVNC